MDEKFNHHLYSDCCITLALYKDVTNIEQLRQRVMTGEFEATLLKTTMICDPFQVLTAATRAVHLNRIDKMTTKNVHSEVLYCLSPTKNITDSFRKFGIGDKDTSVFVVILNDSDGSKMDVVNFKIEGTRVPICDVEKLTDEILLKKVYKVTDIELKSSTLTDIIVSKIASKEFLTV